MGRIVWAGLLATAWTASAAEPELVRYQFQRVEMAVPIKITLYAPDAASANAAATAAFDRFGQLNAILSDYEAQSELSRLCDSSGSGVPVPVGPELWTVLCRAQEVARNSDGAFDITAAPVIRLWRRARRLHELPSEQRVRGELALVGYRKLRLDPAKRTAELTVKGMRLDAGGVAKGYAADEALAVLAKRGVTRAMIYAGGDIRLGAAPPGRTGWKIGVGATALDGPPRYFLTLADCAVATSGDLWESVEIGGRRYSHVIDPRTGMALTDRCLVTVVAPNGLTADPLSTAVSVLGPGKGLDLIEKTPGAAALIVRAPSGKEESHESKGWGKLNPVKP